MALRWDLRPVFPNAESGDVLSITRRTIISGTLAIVGFGITTWNMTAWDFVIAAVTVLLAFDAGDMRNVFDEPFTLAKEIDEDEEDIDRPLTQRELLYRPEGER